jgi:hypothetical protein
MRKPTKQNANANRSKLEKRSNIPKATGNKRLTQQIRKILGKYYASKYRVG